MNNDNVLDILTETIIRNGGIGMFKHVHTTQQRNSSMVITFGFKHSSFECRIIVANTRKGYIISLEGKDYPVELEDIIPTIDDLLYNKFKKYRDPQEIKNMFHNQIWERRED